jgi:hypothetical protein
MISNEVQSTHYIIIILKLDQILVLLFCPSQGQIHHTVWHVCIVTWEMSQSVSFTMGLALSKRQLNIIIMRLSISIVYIIYKNSIHFKKMCCIYRLHRANSCIELVLKNTQILHQNFDEESFIHTYIVVVTLCPL